MSSLLELGKASEALHRVKTQPLPCEDAGLRFQRAIVYAENQAFTEAVQELTDSVMLDYQAIGISDESIDRRLQLIIQNKPTAFGTTLVKALLPAFADDLAETKQNLEKLVRNFPKESQAWYHLANVLSLLGEQARAKEVCRNALAVDRNCKDALMLLRRLLQKDGEIQALRILSKELTGAAEPLEFALEWAKEKGETQTAKQIASELLGVDPTNAIVMVCLLKGMDPDGLEYARLARRLALSLPIDFELRSLAARDLLLGGEAKEALECYDSLFADGYDSIPDLLMHGLAFLAAQPATDLQS